MVRNAMDDPLQVPVTEAKGQLTELVRRALAGEEIVLTRHGQATVRLVPVRPVPNVEERRRFMSALLERARVLADSGATTGPSAARSQDFLYDDEGLPR
jgi:prevent-host-death family protein